MRSLFGVRGDPTEADLRRAREAKWLVWEGLRTAIDQGAVDRDEAGALVDATYGEEVLRAARAEHVRTAMPVEASGVTPLAFEHPDWRERLEVLDPDWAKVLIRYHPDDDPAVGRAQRASLLELSTHCAATSRPLMLELLVPPRPDQAVDRVRFDAETRPGLMVRALHELRDAGISVDTWKVEGLERAEDAERVAAAAAGPCIVLGRGADREAVDRWLAVAASVDGFDGFAIGRSIWWEPLRALLAGSSPRPAAIGAIAAEYGRYAAVYRAACEPPGRGRARFSRC